MATPTRTKRRTRPLPLPSPRQPSQRESPLGQRRIAAAAAAVAAPHIVAAALLIAAATATRIAPRTSAHCCNRCRCGCTTYARYRSPRRGSHRNEDCPQDSGA
ncbi:hypothetical protein NDU88_007829 [Pleurodeles waltl]|uniref:Uncharacterized protein n=1 Tax=Pleurodeles waltl TaxID=8319 RepID=A0AAV7VQT2_PLEWA|nr:hypothetical protein NDU88_007829 [Pleurodeles waltl]